MKLTKKIEYIFFILFLFFQNFAIIRTKTFGINSLVFFMFVVSLLNFKKYYMRIKSEFVIFFFIILGFIILGAFFNKILYIMQIFRNILIVWFIYVIYIFIDNVYKEKNANFFWKYYFNIAFIMFLYGIYEYFANIFSLPLFMNIFNNNPSYGIRGMNYYYGGWIDKGRLYNVFFEPSVFSIFLVFNFFLLKEIKYINKNKKIHMYIIILFNLFFTYARTGWITLAYMSVIFFIYKILKGNARFFENLFLLLPFINLFLMMSIGLFMYTDLSSLARTYSAFYYLKNSFDNLKSILIGHGCGSIINGVVNEKYVELYAHNGYIDLIYQYGWLLFICISYAVKKLLGCIKNHRYLIVGVISTFCCMGSYYNVETIIALVVVIFVFCKRDIEKS